ncbi:MAG: DUF29 domain-containing protein [Methylobacterium mesophilicum]|nr:DUF29 domain-containing protein [Methylobacterium mesophilicum]
MNKVERIARLTPYEQDIARWSDEQASLIRAGRFDAVDRENIAEEIESLGRSDRREIRSRIGVILLHLLKWEFQPEKRKVGWRFTLREQRHQLEIIFEESPSLVAFARDVFERDYELAQTKAMDETGLPSTGVPQNCPYPFSNILDSDFFPGAAWTGAGEA